MGNVFLSSRNHHFRFSSVRADSKSLRHSYRYELEKQFDENQPQGIYRIFLVPGGVEPRGILPNMWDRGVPRWVLHPDPI